MEPFIVLAADQARARLFKSDRRTGPITEIVGLANPEARLREQDLVSDASGGAHGGSAHVLGGGNNEAHHHYAEVFAKDVGAALDKAVETYRPSRIYVLASPNFLGMLRNHWSAGARSHIAEEYPKDVTHMQPEQIRQHLPELL